MRGLVYHIGWENVANHHIFADFDAISKKKYQREGSSEITQLFNSGPFISHACFYSLALFPWDLAVLSMSATDQGRNE